MKKRIRLLLTMGLTILMASQLAACDNWNEDKAEKYMTAILESCCTGENDTGMEFSDADNEEIKTLRDEGLEEGVQEGIASLEGEGFTFTDDEEQSAKDLVDKSLSALKYEVGDATKNDEGFEVPVTVHPVDIYANVDMEEVIDGIIEDVKNGDVTIDNVQSEAVDRLLEAANKGLDDPVYGDDYETTVQIFKNEDDNSYEASEDDLNDLFEHAFVESEVEDYSPKWNEFLATEYVEATMQVLRDGENTTGVDFEDLQAEQGEEIRQSIIDSTVEYQLSDIDSESISDSSVKEFKDAISDCLANIKYEVGNASAQDDTVEVRVTMHPIDLYYDVDLDALSNEVAALYQSGQITDDQLYDKILEMLAQKISSAMENPTYADEYTTTLVFDVDEDGTLNLTDDSVEDIMNHIIVE